MNKSTQKSELPIKHITLNKAETDSFRHQMIIKTSYLLNNDHPSTNIIPDSTHDNNSETKSIFIKKQALERTLSIYQWRYKTCYPVPKPVKLVVKSFTGNSKEKKTLCKRNSESLFEIWNLDDNIFELLVTTEKINYRLSEIGPLSLPQFFLFLKEVLVGFECLIDIFGIFSPSEDMIAVNEFNEWRFWISEDFASNSKKQSNISEADFVLKLIKIIESKLPNSRVGLKFFQEIKKLPLESYNFLNLIEMANVFISLNKILVAKRFFPPSNISLKTSVNRSHVKMNRTLNEIKKNLNDCTNPYDQANMDHSVKHMPSISKLSSIKNFEQKQFTAKSFNNTPMNRQIGCKKQNQFKSCMKISQFYSAQTLNNKNIQKGPSFQFPPTQNINSKLNKTNNQTAVQKQKQSSRSPLTPKRNPNKNLKTQAQQIFMRSGVIGSRRERKVSFQNPHKTQSKVSKCPKQFDIQNRQIKRSKKQRKNSYYNYQKPVGKEAFSVSPKGSSSKAAFFKDDIHQNKRKVKKPFKRENILMNDQSLNRSRKYSQHVQRIKSLDQFVRKNKKMSQSTVIQVDNQINGEIKYVNLKNKDIGCQNRHQLIGFGQLPIKKDNRLSQIKKTNHHNKFEEIIKSMRSKSSGDRDQEKVQLNEVGPRSTKCKVNLFERARQVAQAKIEWQIDQEGQFIQNSKNLSSPQPYIQKSNTNNQTVQTLNKSELNHAKGSQQSNSLSNNNNFSNIPQSDSNSNHKNYLFVQNRKGLISQSNLSDFSCKTYQPAKEIDKKIIQIHQREKHMTISQDCFNSNNPNGSESSEDYLKSKNWNKKISGLFSDVASIKILKESSHFGEQLELFQKDYLKNVKLEKLDKFGKQLKGSIIEQDDGNQISNFPSKGNINNSFSLIGEVKEEPNQNNPSYLQCSSSLIYKSKPCSINKTQTLPNTDTRNRQSSPREASQEEQQTKEGFNFETQLQKISQNR